MFLCCVSSGVAHHGVRSGGAAHPGGLPAADPGAEDPARGVREQSQAAADGGGGGSSGGGGSADSCGPRSQEPSAHELSAW